MQIAQVKIVKHILRFLQPAKTSRDTLWERPVWYVLLYDHQGYVGIGEVAPIFGLSPEEPQGFEQQLQTFAQEFLQITLDPKKLVCDFFPQTFPSVNMGFQTALLDLVNKNSGLIFSKPFYENRCKIPINGLVWMNTFENMSEQIDQKIAQGFTCIKLKIGAIHWEDELLLIKKIRQKYTAQQIMIRVDANGAFAADEALSKLDALAKFSIDSIEQPIAAQKVEQLAMLCRNSPLPIALDESLICVPKNEQAHLLDTVKPAHIVLKPSLHGGFAGTSSWIQLAEDREIGWWLTSALESNVGLNAIASFTAQYDIQRPQGLGTGKLYHNNIAAPLQISEGYLSYSQALAWDFSQIL